MYDYVWLCFHSRPDMDRSPMTPMTPMTRPQRQVLVDGATWRRGTSVPMVMGIYGI